jgi:3-deoxy-7-phosphoheptulonate synthase
MVVVMQEGAREEQIQHVIERLIEMGFAVHRSSGVKHTVLGAVGAVLDFDTRNIELLEGVREVVRISAPYKLASRSFRPDGTRVQLGKGIVIGGEEIVVMAGPCSAESREQVLAVAEVVSRNGAKILRGGAFKPRTSPYSFQGLGEPALQWLREAADKHNMLVISEVMDHTKIPLMLDYADILQVGARNMQNFDLLKELGKVRKPVMLKRGLAATIEEWLLSAEYVMQGGNYDVILCERGIRTFESYTRNTLDLAAIPSSTNSRTCPSSSILRTAPAAATKSLPWPAPRSPPAPTVSWSKSTTTPTTPSATAPSLSIPTSSFS